MFRDRSCRAIKLSAASCGALKRFIRLTSVIFDSAENDLKTIRLHFQIRTSREVSAMLGIKEFFSRIFKKQKRKHPRYKLHDGVLVEVGQWGRRKERIGDLSMGGMAFYHAGDDYYYDAANEITLTPDMGVPVRNIWFSMISDIELGGDGGYNMKRKGVQFKYLTATQREELRRFIETHAVGRA